MQMRQSVAGWATVLFSHMGVALFDYIKAASLLLFWPADGVLVQAKEYKQTEITISTTPAPPGVRGGVERPR